MIIRYITAIATGSFVTLGLFFVMQSLIAMGQMVIVERVPGGTLDFIRVAKQEIVNKDKPTVLPPLPEISDPRPPVEQTDPNTENVGVRLQRTNAPTSDPVMSIGNGLNDGPLVALVRVEPSYPGPATARNLEGWVIVEFDVNPDGSVSNVRIVSSSHRVFEKSAIRAAERFRYKARVVDGVAQTSRGIQSKFTYRMEQG